MKNKRPRLQMSVRYALKDMPENYRGLVGENWTYGIKPAKLSSMCRSVIGQVVAFYNLFTDVEEMNAELDKLREWLAGVGVTEKRD